jgi:hypothetical protein
MAYRGKMAVKKDGESSYSYYECVNKHERCPTCEAHAGYDVNRNTRVKRCYPEKRITVSGWLWWRKACPLGGVHDHYRCQKCNTIWVCFHTGMTPSNKVHV